MSRWWRAYEEAVDDPKLCLLSDRAHRGWFNLMCVASAQGGTLPSIEVLTVKLRLPAKKVEAIISELKERGLLDDIEGKLQPHNWGGRQYKGDAVDPTNADRQKRYRNRHRNGSNGVTLAVIPPSRNDPP